MANTLTNLIPDLYEAIDVVSREMVGFIPAVTLSATAERAALNENIRVPITPAATAENVTPGQLPPDDGDQNIGNNVILISQARMVPFRWAGEEQKGVNNQAPNGGYAAIRQNQIQQAIRTLVNEVDANIGTLYSTASRAEGTAGTTPFATGLGDTAQMRKILADNGAPLSDMQCVIDTTAGANLRSLTQLTKANEAGTIELRAQGKLLELHGFTLRESAGVSESVPVGSVTGAVTASGAKGATSVTLTTPAGGAVALLAGDVITFAGDPNKYVVAAAANIGASTSGAVTIGAPGLRTTINTAAVTVLGPATRNMAFARSAIVLATRLPALPEEGDMAEDRTIIVDPRSGIAFEFAMYKQYRRVRYEVAIAYGWANIKTEHTGLMLG
ncbi:MAG TPA: hypothetical protein VMA74_14630 [Dyella sp.]|uniref:hypothetical protein n=1 Tax=Dyella sp. TaxID=1869338 RepID=UPI002C1AA242|nr:hypothetical protein [Dyella sp.]HUB90958.1 hypothetical protein [Dyella sp.]